MALEGDTLTDEGLGGGGAGDTLEGEPEAPCACETLVLGEDPRTGDTGLGDTGLDETELDDTLDDVVDGPWNKISPLDPLTMLPLEEGGLTLDGDWLTAGAAELAGGALAAEIGDTLREDEDTEDDGVGNVTAVGEMEPLEDDELRAQVWMAPMSRLLR